MSAAASEKAWAWPEPDRKHCASTLSFDADLAAAKFGAVLEEVSFGVMCIVEIRPGRGGQDAEEFAGSIARAISAWSTRHNQPASMSDSGTRSITLTLPRTPVMALR